MRIRPLLIVLALFAAVPALDASRAQASFIVYACGNNLCRIGPDGTGRAQVTRDGTSVQPYQWPSLTRSGKRMSWLRANDVMIGDPGAHAAAGPLTRLGWFDVIRPDGAAVAVMELSAVFPGAYARVFDRSGSILMDGPEPAIYSIGWAPDNQHLLLPMHDRDSGGVAICLETRNPLIGWDCGRRVAFTPGAYLSDPALSPDGHTLAVTVLPSSSATGGHLALYDYRTGGLIRTLTAGTADALPAFSPDGALIVFQRGTSLYRTQVNATPGAERRLVTSGQTPTWGGPVDPAASGLTLSTTQHGNTVRARLTVRLGGSALEAWLVGSGRRLAGRTLGHARTGGVLSGSRSVSVGLNAAGRSALARWHVLALTLRIKVQPPIGAPATLTHRLSLRR